ncbi:MAG: GNAT family N-acetyltransferase [Thaumarchaeota archaeon]|nr:GNAT family N-acetyltransferase [Nitrososphaerota archaeon]
MRIVEWDELPPGTEEQVHMMDLSAGWTPQDFKTLKELIRLGYPASDYFALFAMEGDQVLSTVRVLNLPVTTRLGTESVAAIQGVLTRYDQSGKGLARKVLTEVHRRERSAGRRLSMLWTGRTSFSHDLYSSLGYSDFYTPQTAARRVTRGRQSDKRYAFRKVREADAGLLEQLHARATRGRLGFTPRPAGVVTSFFRFGLVRPGALRLVTFDERPIGYVEFQSGDGWAKSEEVVVEEERISEVLSLLESLAGNKWLTLRGTFVGDASDELKRRGYSISPLAYYGMMGLQLEGKSVDMAKELGIPRRRFSCQLMDFF